MMFRFPLHIPRRHLKWSINYEIVNRQKGQLVWLQLRTLGVSRHGLGNDFEDSNDFHRDDDTSIYSHNPNFMNDKNKITKMDEDNEKERERQRFREELEQRTGRGWSDPWEITDEACSTVIDLEDMIDWKPEFASKFSLDRLKVLDGGVPTLKQLCELKLPPPPPPRPNSDKRTYKAYRKKLFHEYILSKVKAIAEPQIDGIKMLNPWEEKQDAVDELFESVEFQLKEVEEILGRQMKFGALVEKAIEDYLKNIQQREEEQFNDDITTHNNNNKPMDEDNDKTHEQFENKEYNEDEVLPIFMDLFDKKDIRKEAVCPVVPKILHPLKPPHTLNRNGAGRMVEEWELAADEETKRILIRESTQKIAHIIENNLSPRIFLDGDSGCGKTAALCSIVASARTSGHIVLFAPDGDRLRKHGFYVVPNPKNPDLYDIPLLSKEMCENLLESHEHDLVGFVASNTTREKFLDKRLKRRMIRENKDELSLVGLLKLGAQDEKYSSMSYSVVVETLINQEEKPFLIVLDEFNCYYDYGHYFHMDYDEECKKPIPLDQISFFKPLLGSMNLLPKKDQDDCEKETTKIKCGGIVVAISERRAVARKFTDNLLESAREEEGASDDMHIVTIPRYSSLEVEHILSNFDVIGIGRLRFDKGDTVLDEQEVSYLKMISGSNGQQLLDSCIV